MSRFGRALAAAAMLVLAAGTPPIVAAQSTSGDDVLAEAAAQAQRKLRQTFSNLAIEDFGPAPVKGVIYQAIAGGKVIYYAPDSETILFAAVYDRNGVNLTALAQDANARRRLAAIDRSKALVIGDADAPEVIEFTDPDCPYCRALDRFWTAKAGEGKRVRRLIFFVTGIHPEAAAKAEHILCAPDPAAAFRSLYAGSVPKTLLRCPAGRARVEEHGAIVHAVGIGGTPTLSVEGRLINGFQQAELEAFLAAPKPDAPAPQ